MSIITRIETQKKRPVRRSIYLDGQFSFGCNQTVVARFPLRVGLEITPEKLKEIEAGEIRQSCLDKAFDLISRQNHSVQQLRTKLKRAEFSASLIEDVLQHLGKLGYVNDARFATAWAASSVARKRTGPRRAKVELLRAGVTASVADKAVVDAYADAEIPEIIRQLILKQLPRLERFDSPVRRRRLTAFLQRRGFELRDIHSILPEFLSSR